MTLAKHGLKGLGSDQLALMLSWRDDDCRQAFATHLCNCSPLAWVNMLTKSLGTFGSLSTELGGNNAIIVDGTADLDLRLAV